MNKSELIDAIANVSGQTKVAIDEVLSALAEVATDAIIAGDEVTIPGIGKLTAPYVEAHYARNPSTGGEVEVPARSVPKFKLSSVLKKTVIEASTAAKKKKTAKAAPAAPAAPKKAAPKAAPKKAAPKKATAAPKKMVRARK